MALSIEEIADKTVVVLVHKRTFILFQVFYCGWTLFSF